MSQIISRFKSPRPAGVALILGLAVLAFVVGAGTAQAATLAQEPPAFVLPPWFLGLVPALAWAINTLLFKAIESGSGKEMDSTTKRIIVVAISLAIAAGLVLSGSVALPAPIPAEPDPMLWGAWVVLMTGYIWAGATTIYVAIEAAKAVAGIEKTKLPA